MQMGSMICGSPMWCCFLQEWLEHYWDILVFVEGCIYQLDEANEDAMNQLIEPKPQNPNCSGAHNFNASSPIGAISCS